MAYPINASIFMIVVISCLSRTSSRMVNRQFRDVNGIPDERKNTADFCEKFGYDAEQHEIATKDGYFLTIFRILSNGLTKNKTPIVMQHGIVLSSDQWVFRGDQDLAFILSREGYDVWMSNTRGTLYSRHTNYTKNDHRFWDYTIDEISLMDLPAIIDYILQVTEKPSLAYIGHSRATAMATMLLSTKQEYNKKIHLMQFLGPVIYTKYARCPIYEIAGNRPTSLISTSTFQKLVKSGRILTVFSTNRFLRSVLTTMCQTGTMIDRVCPFLLFFINGEDFKMFNQTLIPNVMSHFYLGVSSKELVHLLQISESDRFQKFDYGSKNVEIYGTKQPPIYDISKVLPPAYLYYGSNDLFVSEKDLKKYIIQLPNFRSAFKVPYSKFNHIDYIWGKNTNQILFPTFLKDINEFHDKFLL